MSRQAFRSTLSEFCAVGLESWRADSLVSIDVGTTVLDAEQLALLAQLVRARRRPLRRLDIRSFTCRCAERRGQWLALCARCAAARDVAGAAAASMVRDTKMRRCRHMPNGHVPDTSKLIPQSIHLAVQYTLNGRLNITLMHASTRRCTI